MILNMLSPVQDCPPPTECHLPNQNMSRNNRKSTKLKRLKAQWVFALCAPHSYRVNFPHWVIYIVFTSSMEVDIRCVNYDYSTVTDVINFKYAGWWRLGNAATLQFLPQCSERQLYI